MILWTAFWSFMEQVKKSCLTSFGLGKLFFKIVQMRKVMRVGLQGLVVEFRGRKPWMAYFSGVLHNTFVFKGIGLLHQPVMFLNPIPNTKAQST